MSRSASKIRDSVQKEFASLKTRRSVSVDTRSRGSYVPDRNRASSEEERKLSGGNRFTMRWGGARKSSIINAPEGKRKDVRPLTDRAYQKKKAQELAEFLEQSGFTPTISSTKLMGPSRKDFENIFEFLYKYIDPAYEVKKIEEEAPKILKNIGYPFTVNKSAFVYVARTNWPSLLGILIWLMDVYKFALKVDMNNLFGNTKDDEKAQVHTILLRYICQCYHCGADNEEDDNAAFTEMIKSTFTEDSDEVEAINNEKKSKLQAVESKIKVHKDLTALEEQLDKKIQTYQDYISKMQAHYQKRQEICDKLREELKLKEAAYSELQNQVTKLQDAYDAQGFDGKKHLNYFKTQQAELSNKLEKKRAMCTEMQDKFHEVQIKHGIRFAEVKEAAQSSVKRYNDIIEALKSILNPLSVIKGPAIQKILGHFQLEFPVWEIQFNKYDAESNRAFKSSLEDILERIKSTGDIIKQRCASMNQKLNEIEVRKSEITVKLKLLSVQEKKQEQELISKKNIAEDEMSVLEAQSEKIVEVIKSLQEERAKLEKTYREMMEEKNVLINFREQKEKELVEYLAAHKEIFAWCDASEQEVNELTLACGNEIANALEELKFL